MTTRVENIKAPDISEKKKKNPQETLQISISRNVKSAKRTYKSRSLTFQKYLLYLLQ